MQHGGIPILYWTWRAGFAEFAWLTRPFKQRRGIEPQRHTTLPYRNSTLPMFIADSQVHIWTANTAERPWIPGRHGHRSVPLEANELLKEMDVAGVSRAILIPPALDGERNDLVLSAARQNPHRFAVMGRLDPYAPGARDMVARLRQEPGMLGLRFSFTLPHLVGALTDERTAWLWKDAEAAGIPLMVLVTHRMVPLVDRIAERHPNLKLVLCHLALSTGAVDDEAFQDFDRLLVLGKRHNVAVKASALPCYTRDSYPYRALQPHLRRLYDAFGPRRIFWGTDLARLPCTYRQAISMFTEEMPWLSAADLEWIMGRGLCEWLDWAVDAGTNDMPSLSTH